MCLDLDVLVPAPPAPEGWDKDITQATSGHTLPSTLAASGEYIGYDEVEGYVLGGSVRSLSQPSGAGGGEDNSAESA